MVRTARHQMAPPTTRRSITPICRCNDGKPEQHPKSPKSNGFRNKTTSHFHYICSFFFNLFNFI